MVRGEVNTMTGRPCNTIRPLRPLTWSVQNMLGCKTLQLCWAELFCFAWCSSSSPLPWSHVSIFKLLLASFFAFLNICKFTLLPAWLTRDWQAPTSSLVSQGDTSHFYRPQLFLNPPGPGSVNTSLLSSPIFFKLGVSWVPQMFLKFYIFRMRQILLPFLTFYSLYFSTNNITGYTLSW